MYFSRAELSPEGFGSGGNWELGANCYRAHLLVWTLFSDHRKRERDFLFRWEIRERRPPLLYVVSRRPPVDRDGIFRRLETKKYAPRLQEGLHLGFILRANPVVKKRDEKGKQRVHDVVMNRKRELLQAGEWRNCPFFKETIIQQASVEWLNERARQYGFSIEEEGVMVERYLRHRFRKPQGERPVVIATVDFRGRLQVEDQEVFTRALMEGIGPSKGFGCGLMMIRPL